ncbi:transglycosylase SLT domain-containing protein [Elioraea sp.]|uniref:lytic transglycosylase domain-containing protein n=1 Tax=Elioraea sp. TaxID=2185103 RepID=UPI003F706850
MQGTEGAWGRGRTAGLIWGAAFLALVGLSGTARGNDQVAFAVPRPSFGGMPGLPSVLGPADAALYRRIFAAQVNGRLAAADADIARLSDRLLMGHVLADRLLGPHTRARPEELSAWLEAYADHPDAPRIHRLLRLRAPRGTTLPTLAEVSELPAAETPPEEIDPGARAFSRNPALDRTVRQHIRAEEFPRAIGAIRGAGRIDAAYAASLHAEVARALFLRGLDEQALGEARAAIRSSPKVAEAQWFAGLASWRLGRIDAARRHFEATARAEIGSSARRAAGAFWTARAALRQRDHRNYVPWLLEAAQSSRSFYGLLARRALGIPCGFAWERDTLGENEAALLAETAQGLRALALLQIGQTERAEAELRRLAPSAHDNPSLARALLVVTSQSGMAELAMRIAPLVESRDGRPRDYARFPLPHWRPDEAAVDPALVIGMARVESNFDASAVSRAGARGVMQIMPLTASYVAGRPELAGRQRHRLHDTELNLEIGSRYIAYLARHPEVSGDLLRLIAAYNAGPGNVARWNGTMSYGNDPLMFLETIPIHETRAYVQRVLAFSWIYASRMGRPAPSLDALAAGRWPRYHGPEEITARDPGGAARLH